MKRIVIIIGMIVTLSACATEKQSVKQVLPDCISSIESNGEYKLTIIANKDEIKDKEEFAEQVIEQVRNNDFKTILFSYDLAGYPISLDMTVYLNEKDKDVDNPVMRISLQPEKLEEGYNIVDDLDKFNIQID